MRFGDGAWRMLEDVTPSYLARVDSAEVAERQAVFHVSSRPETTRGATLEGRMFTVRLTSPGPNVFRIQVTHHKGRKHAGPAFPLRLEPQIFDSSLDGARRRLRSGDLELSLDENPWRLEFTDRARGEPLTSSPYKALGLMEKKQ